MYCLALPYKNNQRDVSRIPDGEYEAEILSKSPSFNYPHIWIKDVSGRDNIKIHILNDYHETEGCFGVGLGFDRNNKTIENSEKALYFLINNLKDSKFKVIVKTV